jgi:Spy/CpxP family protein refolding chaperone
MISLKMAAVSAAVLISAQAASAADLSVAPKHSYEQVTDHRPQYHGHGSLSPTATESLFEQFLHWLKRH